MISVRSVHCSLLAICLAGLTAVCLACQRSTSDEERSISKLRATHPWQLPGSGNDYSAAGEFGGQQEEIPADGKVELPPARGPQLAETDTLDVDLLPGSWVMVALVTNEQMGLRTTADYSTLVLQESNAFRVFDYNDGELGNTLQGEWHKVKPGVLRLSMRGQDGQEQANEVFAELFANDFLYLWSYGGHWGNWYVRQVQDEPQALIGYNRYDSSIGSFVFSNVGKDSYYGELTSPEGSVWQLNGYLVDGILNMAWTDARNNASGYAAFIVEDDWNTLRGAYWKDDYEARPFTAEWTATADR